MPRQETPPKPAEIAAIKAAEVEWLRWRSIYAYLPPDMPEGRQKITKLREAARAMVQALEPFAGDQAGDTISLLLSAMQDLRLKSQTDYRKAINEMMDLLHLLGMACDQIGGSGGRQSAETRRWVCIAADAWVAAGFDEPTAKGRFFKALAKAELFRLKPTPVPKISEDIVKTALKKWHEVRSY